MTAHHDSKKAKPRELKPIGWRERISLPQLGLDQIKAKMNQYN